MVAACGLDAAPELPLPALAAAALVAALPALLTAAADLLQGRAGYMGSGEVVARIDLAGGGGLQVTAVEDAGAGAPAGAAPGSRQQWRVLRFQPCLDYVQAVTRVCVAPPGGPEPRVRLLSQVLSLPYNRSLVAVTLAALAAAGAPVLAAARGEHGAGPLLRVLCLGLGGGSVPSFLAGALPGCHVDVAELEPAVLRAATDAMGFRQGPRLRVGVEGGGPFALRAAEGAGAGGAYDAVVSPKGRRLQEMYGQGGDVVRALARGLLRALSGLNHDPIPVSGITSEPGLLSANFLPGTDVVPRLRAYGEALRERGLTPGPGFSAEAEEGNLMTVQVCGGPTGATEAEWRGAVARGAREVGAAIGCDFDMEEEATRRFRVW
ncbi:unnamed protein product [Prorocentrum cordatum]|uniref:Uncharacterized protein n=1 Tax=Prorocentrum cordatum TaxID=2364126 RepID=A0ABN9V3D6_9DINO|nr:unnamed protein product [Polarella glacialis]